MPESQATPNYSSARARFLAAARAARATVESIDHPDKGPAGEVLATDLAWIGPRNAPAVLLMVSATHGVEGHCGSGAQSAWLERDEATRLPADVAVLLVHAINPHGFAWSRRVTEGNVDLNRNWIDFAAPLPENAGYDALSDVISPTRWDDARKRAYADAVNAYRAAHGEAAFIKALSGGQYRHAYGIFFGGTAPVWSRRTLTNIFATMLGQAAHIGIIDFHTGLGPNGYGEPIISARRGSAIADRAIARHGLRAIPIGGPESASAELSGDWLAAAPALLPGAEVTGIALEFGTVPTAAVIDALRADAWLHCHGDPHSPQGKAIKAQMLAAFYGDNDHWRGMVEGQSLIAARQAVAGLKLALS
jgi:hypothetical protein